MARNSFGALAMETCATKGEPWPARNVSATVFFSTHLPWLAAPKAFMSPPPSIGVESEFWPPVFE